MKNKKGFTLIELLVVIALTISILGIAIVSLTGVGNRKKEEAWDKVKKQIEVAAETYFFDNEYKFEGLDDKSTGKISVGTLVRNDYLNKITNPVTNKAVDYCSMVDVVKEGGKYTATYTGKVEKNTDGTCIFENLVMVAEPGAPAGEINYYNNSNVKINYKNWFNISDLGENGVLFTCIKADTKKNGKIVSAKVGDFNTSYNETNKSYCASVISDNKYLGVKFTLVNTSGKKWIAYNDINKDTKKPTGMITINSTETKYSSNVVNTYLDFSDEMSKVGIVKFQNKEYTNFVKGENGYEKRLSFNNVKLTNSLDGSIKNLNATIYDNAGNENIIKSSNYVVYKSCKEENLVADGDWYDKKGATCSVPCGGGTIAQEQKQKDKFSGTSCGIKTRIGKCNSQLCPTTTKKTTTTTKKTTTKKTTTTSALCEDISINIPKWSGTNKFNVSASSKSSITKISSVFYEEKPGSDYTTNNEKNASSKITQCNPPYYSCKANYTYLSVCATNKCGRKVCEYKLAGASSQVRHYDNKKKK